MMLNFTIASAYKWPQKDKSEKTTNSEIAIKTLTESIKKRFNGKTVKHTDEQYSICYKRLRASAGKTMLDSIIKRIETAQLIIFDISHPNENVFLELGIALYLSKIKKELSIYLIKESNGTDILKGLPSDLQGYFISTYVVKNSIATFKDSGSLLMSIVSDVNDFYQQRGNSYLNTDEITFK